MRREQLIRATIDELAKRGYADLTLADVAERAGLSRGIVNFHFDSKRKLLVETLRFMADEYAEFWHQALERAGLAPAERLWALVAADFDAEVCNRRKIAAWCAFWGEAKSRPIYREICGERDLIHSDTLRGLCRELVAEGGYEHDPDRVAEGLDALLEGLWLHLLFQSGTTTRETLYATAVEHLTIVFPEHFTPAGVLRRAGPPQT